MRLRDCQDSLSFFDKQHCICQTDILTSPYYTRICICVSKLWQNDKVNPFETVNKETIFQQSFSL